MRFRAYIIELPPIIIPSVFHIDRQHNSVASAAILAFDSTEERSKLSHIQTPTTSTLEHLGLHQMVLAIGRSP